MISKNHLGTRRQTFGTQLSALEQSFRTEPSSENETEVSQGPDEIRMQQAIGAALDQLESVAATLTDAILAQAPHDKIMDALSARYLDVSPEQLQNATQDAMRAVYGTHDASSNRRQHKRSHLRLAAVTANLPTFKARYQRLIVDMARSLGYSTDDVIALADTMQGIATRWPGALNGLDQGQVLPHVAQDIEFLRSFVDTVIDEGVLPPRASSSDSAKIMDACRVLPHGTRIELMSPPVDHPSNANAYAQDILRILDDVVRPYAIEVEWGEWDEYLGIEPSGEAMLMVRPDLPEGVAVHPHFHHDEAPRSLNATSSTLTQILQANGPESPAKTWFSIQFIATGAQIHGDDGDHLQLAGVSSATAPIVDASVNETSTRWVVGPVDDGTTPPITVAMSHDEGALRVEVEGRWSRWSETSRPEHQDLQKIATNLKNLGFVAL